MLDRVLDALGTLRSPFAPYEADLHLRVGECLSAAGLPAVHEALLAPGCRIDYLVGGVGVEIKKGRPDPAALRRAFALHGTPKAVVVVHLYGNPAKLDEITAICREHGVPLIEDAAEALGSTYNGQKCGTFGDFGALSFNGNKIITTSGGGMLLCRTEDEAKHALKLSTQARENAPWYQHEEIGYNYRMSNICAGIGRGQMKVLPLRVEQKRAIFARYCENLKGLPLTMQPELPCAESNRWLSVALLDKGCNVTPGEMLTKLNEVGIEGRYLWKPMHLQPVFANCPFVSVSDAPVGDDLFARGVCLPSDTKMSTDDVDRVCDTIRGMF